MATNVAVLVTVQDGPEQKSWKALVSDKPTLSSLSTCMTLERAANNRPRLIVAFGKTHPPTQTTTVMHLKHSPCAGFEPSRL